MSSLLYLMYIKLIYQWKLTTNEQAGAVLRKFNQGKPNSLCVP